MRYSWKPKVILMTSTPHTSDYKHIVEFTIKKSFCSCPHGCAACRGGLRYYKEFQIRIAQKPRAIKTCTSSPILSSKAPSENRTRERKVPGVFCLLTSRSCPTPRTRFHSEPRLAKLLVYPGCGSSQLQIIQRP